MSRIDPTYKYGPDFLAMALVFVRQRTPIQEINPQTLLEFFSMKFRESLAIDLWHAQRCLDVFKANYEEGKNKCAEWNIELYNKMCEQVLLGFDAAEKVLWLLSQHNPNPNPLNECFIHFPGNHVHSDALKPAIVLSKIICKRLQDDRKTLKQIQDFICSDILNHPVFKQFSSKIKPTLRQRYEYHMWGRPNRYYRI